MTIFSEPVYGESFFDRSEVLALLEKRTQALKGGYRQNIAILGTEFIGKSSIIHHFLYCLKDTSILPIYVEAKRGDFNNFVKRFAFSMLYNYAAIENKKAGDDLESLVKQLRKSIPRTADSIEKLLEHCKKEASPLQIYQLLMDLPQVFKEETKKPCVLIIDEFQNMDSYKIENAFSILGKKMMVQKDTMFIFISSWRSTAKKILSEKLNLLFGNFELVEVKGFNNRTAKEFLESRLKGLELQDKHKHFLSFLTDGHPLYLDIIARKMNEVAKIKSPAQIDMPFILDSVADILFDSLGALNQHFSNKILRFANPKNANYICIMTGLANNNHRLKDLAKFCDKNSKDLSKSLSRLMELDLAVKNGAFYNLNDRLFKLWLRNVYDKKQKCISQSLAVPKEQFKKNLEEKYASFNKSFDTVSSERILELIKSFSNETIEIDHKLHVLPYFTNIDAKDSHDGDFYITARSPKQWVFKVVDREVTENDILKFTQKYKNSKRQISRKILVALDGSEINAKLLAKEEKMWTWDLSSINMLLDLYNKAPLIKH